MPKELKTYPDTFHRAIKKYHTLIGREPYQPLELLLSKIKDLWISHTNENKPKLQMQNSTT